MSITLKRIDPTGTDTDDLIEFLTTQQFPFHVDSEGYSSKTVRERIETGHFLNEENESFWLDHDRLGRVGFTRLEGLRDDTPMFDLRLSTRFRGQGLGVEALEAIAHHLFSRTKAGRLEGQTRDDNHAMRTVFERSGWTKEAHYRQAWPVSGESPRDSVAYAILREEWSTGRDLGLQWHDRPHFREHTRSNITFTSNVMPSLEELLTLYGAVGWSAYTTDPLRLQRSVRESAHIVCAWNNGALIGSARIVSDFGTLVYLQDVLVDPQFQRRGIGTELISRVLVPFADIRQTVLLTDADPRLTDFYTALNFREVSPRSASPLRAFIRN